METSEDKKMSTGGEFVSSVVDGVVSLLYVTVSDVENNLESNTTNLRVYSTISLPPVTSNSSKQNSTRNMSSLDYEYYTIQENHKTPPSVEMEIPELRCTLEEGLECREQIVCFGEGDIDCTFGEMDLGNLLPSEPGGSITDFPDVLIPGSDKVTSGIASENPKKTDPSFNIQSHHTAPFLNPQEEFTIRFVKKKQFYNLHQHQDIVKLSTMEQMTDNFTDVAVENTSYYLSSSTKPQNIDRYCNISKELKCSPTPTYRICRGRSKCAAYFVHHKLDNLEVVVVMVITVVGFLLTVVLLYVFFKS
ncbi:uncharacterized protein LOC111088943 isoform X2 [Limulus polyphemus]|nr:uncharacterized protein LOC111088943 isoform X2 [Limulus polyphemus]XP_022256048.1 uncharacterized protein LOC111088943 isoform X2 [Limulus polyphemus]